jgi:DNA-binding NtrC family response regulator
MSGRFREDLYYRLNICTINVPPLRDRKEDIYVLAKEFLSVYNKKYGVMKEIDEEGFAALRTYDWPGNVRELENTVHRMIINTRGNVITAMEVDALLNQNVYDEYIVDTTNKAGRLRPRGFRPDHREAGAKALRIRT